METIDKFIEREQLSMTAERIESRPDGQMHDLARHFKCNITTLFTNRGCKMCMAGNPCIHAERLRFDVYFSQGSAWSEDPDLPDVLDTLALNALSVEAVRSFEEWANEYGYDVDSRKAEKAYQETLQEAQNLLTLLGAEAYAQLLYHVERL